MASLLLAQIRLARSSNKPEDVVVNTFHFATEADWVPADITDIVQRLLTFYNGPGGTQGVAAWMSNSVIPNSANVHEVRIYDLGDPVPRVPIHSSTFSLGTTASLPIPAEVAVCLSYRAPLVSGVNNATRRGRIYLGPLAVSATETFSGQGDTRPATAMINQILARGVALMALAAPTTPRWVVFSPTTLTATTVTQVLMDNAFDTQRRRGGAPTTRTILP
jgi:hypothetical protein